MGLTPRILETIPELLKRNPSDMVLKFWTSIYCRYLAPRPATMFRNRLCIDGGLTLFMPPTSASETVFFWDSFSLLFECSSSMSLQATFFYRYYEWYLSCPISHKGMCCCSVMFILIWRPGWFIDLCIVVTLDWRFVFVLSLLIDWDLKESQLVHIATLIKELLHDRCVLKS